jgi:GT2 family glycosyltransferase
MQVSIIIPTYNRLKDLDKCLDSIIIQKKLPKEVIIVDNGSDTKAKNLFKERKNEFKEKGLILKYLKNEENSLTVAKNLGVKYSTGDVISFLDDDLILDKNYYEEIIKVYIEKPNAVGVQGLILKFNKKGILYIFIYIYNILFYISFNETNKCRVLPSLGVTYPSSIDRIIDCEWLSGASTYKRHILEEIKPDENLKKYSCNEDLDLSYRIFKKHPGSLFMTPYAKYWHKGSEEGRLPKKELIYMREVYSLYLFYKNKEQTFKNKLIYFWSKIGILTFNIIFAIFSSKSKLEEIKYTLAAPIYCMKHIKEIKKGSLDFFNKML